MGEKLDATVVIGTYGKELWRRLATKRALPSARAQGVPVIHEHRTTLAEARNAGLAQVETPWVIHLDADDQLTPGYVEAMAEGTADMRVPRIMQVRGTGAISRGRPFMPRVWGHKHECSADCLRFGNWAVIGTAIRTGLAQSVGGWEEWDWSEDWALWARAWQAGGTIEPIHKAVYKAWLRPNSRNRKSHDTIMRVHREIEAAVFG